MKTDITRRGFFGLITGAIAALAAPKPLMALAAPEVESVIDTFIPGAQQWNSGGTYMNVRLSLKSDPIASGQILYWEDTDKYIVTSKPQWPSRFAGMALVAFDPKTDLAYQHSIWIQTSSTIWGYSA